MEELQWSVKDRMKLQTQRNQRERVALIRRRIC